MKKIILIIVLTVSILLGAAYYYFIWQNRPITAPTNTDPSALFPEGTDRTTTKNQTGGDFTGGSSATDTEQQIQPEPESTTDFIFDTKSVYQISDKPVSGKTVIGQGTSTLVLFSDKSTGHVFLSNLTQKTSPQRLTNTTILNTFNSFWSYSVNAKQIDARVTLQYQNKDNQISFFDGKIPTITSSTTAETELLGGNIITSNPLVGITALENQNQLFYLTRTNPGDSIGYLYNLQTKSETPVWQSPLNEWVPRWLSGSLISMQTKAASGVLGSVYLLNTTSKNVTKLIGGVPGLVAAVSPAADKVIYSESGITGLNLNILDIKTNQNKIIPLATIADKCAWDKKGLFVYCGVPTSVGSGQYPNIWYSGVVSFYDNIWEIEAATGKIRLVLDTSKSEDFIGFDVYEPTVSPNGSTLIFTNKKDLTLWALELAQ